MNRRSLLTAALTAPALAVPATAAASPFPAIYRDWREAKRQFSELPLDVAEEVEDEFFRRILEIEQVAADYQPTTIEDLAWKIVFADDDGDMKGNVHQASLAREAAALVGVSIQDRRASAA